MNLELTVESSNPTKNGNYCNKLVAKSVISVQTAFGVVEQERQSTYYLFTKTANNKGVKAQMDISLFDVISKDYEIINEAGNPETIQLKYLYPKA